MIKMGLWMRQKIWLIGMKIHCEQSNWRLRIDCTFKGELSINQAIENASIATRQYAKRQKTWIKTRMTDWDDITDLTL